jgi:hypothetical protein
LLSSFILGVVSVELADDDRLVLVAEGTDVVKLTKLLRKKLGYADVISVTSAEENSREKENWAIQCLFQHGVPAPYGCYTYPRL